MNNTLTVRDAETKFNTSVLDYLDREASVPVVTRIACQGDVSVLRVTTVHDTSPTSQVPVQGAAVVRGENGGNTHAVYGDGPVFWDTAQAGTGLVLGHLSVPEGSQAVMSHPEHGFLLIESGTYRIGRQREMADEIRMVQD